MILDFKWKARHLGQAFLVIRLSWFLYGSNRKTILDQLMLKYLSLFDLGFWMKSWTLGSSTFGLPIELIFLREKWKKYLKITERFESFIENFELGPTNPSVRLVLVSIYLVKCQENISIARDRIITLFVATGRRLWVTFNLCIIEKIYANLFICQYIIVWDKRWWRHSWCEFCGPCDFLCLSFFWTVCLSLSHYRVFAIFVG